ncbi:putative Rz-like lysis protein [Klebsiella phage KMI4]|uniref:Putative Rz-like lysis protein n=1 Tax=Klebsiella phage KMI4 TaxID=2601615 RepID=A0A5B9N7J9_9CAUD|nr:putative Rz-like lysis protein [Klebsiella phage KMI4]
MLEITKRIVPYLVAIMVFAFGWHFGSQSTDTKWKEVVQNEYVKKQTARAETQKAIDAVSAKYQADLEGLEGSTDRIIADLRSDNKRLRVKVKPTSVASGPDGRCLVDGSVELHEATARSLITITQKADLKEKALQDTIRKLQWKGGGEH